MVYSGVGVLIICLVVVCYSVPLEKSLRKRLKAGCDCECGITNRKMRVVGGNETRMNEFPWMAGLNRRNEFKCGATLITTRHVLTAAHCVNQFETEELSIILSDHNRIDEDRSDHIVKRRLKKVTEHEEFDPYSFNNDIAILELDYPVDFTPTIRPACLPPSGDLDYTGRTAIVTGWGQLGENELTSQVLRKAALPVWSAEKCKNSAYGPKKISGNMFCAGFSDGRRDACSGDSGGPLHVANTKGHMEIIGVVSWGRGCARPNLPGIYTKVTNYLNWIKEVLDGECLCRSV